MLSPDMPEVQKFTETTEYVFLEMSGYESVICSSILSAFEGYFGDYHRTRRTIGSELWINPLMLLYIAFDISKVTSNILYFDALAACTSIEPLIGNSMANLFRGNNPFKEKIGARILPTFVSVVDDPFAIEYKNTKLFGTLPIDHEGVKAQKITLFDKGILKTFCSTRTPSRYVKVSNGHSRGGAASPTNVFVTTDKASTRAELYTKLRELGKDQGLKKVLIVRRLQNSMTKMTGGSFLSILGGLTQGAGSISLAPAAVVFEVDVETGKETPSRVTPFAGIGIRTLRDIDVMGDDSAAYPLVPADSRNSGDALSIIAPSFIVKEMDTEKTERSSEKPPLLPNPYFEKQAN